MFMYDRESVNIPNHMHEYFLLYSCMNMLQSAPKDGNFENIDVSPENIIIGYMNIQK